MSEAADTTTRRRLLRAAALTGPGLALGARQWLDVADAADSASPAATATATTLARIGPPAWMLTVLAFADPYKGQIQAPATPAAGTRYVAAEIQIDNGSDQPLDFNPTEIRVRDPNGVEYRGGTAIGTEPLLSPRNLNGGERSRGWVWFTVAADARLVELAYLAPQPEYRWTMPKPS